MKKNKITLSSIKLLVKNGAAIDIDKIKGKKPTRKDLEKIGVSEGSIGINGALFRGKNGKLYAIIARNSSLFYYV